MPLCSSQLSLLVRESLRPGKVDSKVTDLAEEGRVGWRRFTFYQQHFLFESKDSPRLFLSVTAHLPSSMNLAPCHWPTKGGNRKEIRT